MIPSIPAVADMIEVGGILAEATLPMRVTRPLGSEPLRMKAEASL
jgi:hypothetical protein